MGACCSRDDRAAGCGRGQRLSSASHVADAADADAAQPSQSVPTNRAAFQSPLGKTRGVTKLTAQALRLKAIQDGDVHHARHNGAGSDDDDWRSARSAQTNFSWATANDSGDEQSVFSANVVDFSSSLRRAHRGGEEWNDDTAREDDINDDLERTTTDKPQPTLTRQQPGPQEIARVDTNDSAVSADDAGTDDAFRALELATLGMETEALDKLAEDSETLIGGLEDHPRDGDGSPGSGDQTTARSKPVNKKKKSRGNFLTRRFAKVGEGMRMFSAVRLALNKAGGVLDLTSFAGTPIKWHAPHSGTCVWLSRIRQRCLRIVRL